VRSNIVAHSNLSEDDYDAAVYRCLPPLPQRNRANRFIYSCDLEQDIATLPNKHDTVVGSKGVTLSTGQKARVALARAVYARKDFVILDDVFSGLDVNTQKNVFDRLLGPHGLLRKRKSTVVIATHAGKFARTSPFRSY
jgi:ATP-binding cassette, subfamily C (CFTR/MRP), member 1